MRWWVGRRAEERAVSGRWVWWAVRRLWGRACRCGNLWESLFCCSSRTTDPSHARQARPRANLNASAKRQNTRVSDALCSDRRRQLSETLDSCGCLLKLAPARPATQSPALPVKRPRGSSACARRVGDRSAQNGTGALQGCALLTCNPNPDGSSLQS